MAEPYTYGIPLSDPYSYKHYLRISLYVEVSEPAEDTMQALHHIQHLQYPIL